MNRVTSFFKTFFLWELLKGLNVTFRNMLRSKITLNYPEEKTPQSPRFRGLHALRRFLGWKVFIPITIIWIFVEGMMAYFKVGPWS